MAGKILYYMWTCCVCHAQWNKSTTPTCIDCGHRQSECDRFEPVYDGLSSLPRETGSGAPLTTLRPRERVTVPVAKGHRSIETRNTEKQEQHRPDGKEQLEGYATPSMVASTSSVAPVPRDLKQLDITNREASFDEYSTHDDDDKSLRSMENSLFDSGSTESSRSSNNTKTQLMVASFVDVLVRAPSMDKLFALATSSFPIGGSARFKNYFSRVLEDYSLNLKDTAQAKGEDGQEVQYLDAARFILKARFQVSRLIATRYSERAPIVHDFKSVDKKPRLIRFWSTSLAEVHCDESLTRDEKIGKEVDFTTDDLKRFLVSGEPFRLLRHALRSRFVPHGFFHQIHKSIDQFIGLTLAYSRTSPFATVLFQRLGTREHIISELTSQVCSMATDLKTEFSSTAQLDLADFFEIYSQYISMVAINQSNSPSDTHNKSHDDHSSTQKTMPNKNVTNSKSLDHGRGNEGLLPRPIPHEEMLEKIVVDTLPSIHYADLKPHLEFLSSSRAFASFINALHDLAYPSFCSESKRFLKAAILSAESNEDLILAREGRRLVPILTEIQCCIEHNGEASLLFKFPEKRPARVMNSVKLAIEASTAAEWDWWPLQPPSRSWRPGRAQLSWHCSCGTKRQESILQFYSEKLQSIYDKFPLLPDGNTELTDKPTSSVSNVGSQSATSVQSATIPPMNVGSDRGKSSSLSNIDSAVASSDDDGTTVVDLGSGPRHYIYIFFLVRGSEYALNTIDVSSMKARDFFKALREAYHERRGLWRRAFSIFVYNHCDFIKIIRPEPDTFMPGEQRFELPSEHDDQYQYRPRPTDSAPVTRHMFRHYFYGCYDSDALMHRFHASIPLLSACRIRNPAAELLEHFPKRDRKVATSAQSEKVEVCYGLMARECRSFFRVVVYLCLIITPAFWFIFAWIFEWGHGGDLQDATVPMTLMLTAVSMLWAVVYSGSDVRKYYSDN